MSTIPPEYRYYEQEFGVEPVPSRNVDEMEIVPMSIREIE